MKKWITICALSLSALLYPCSELLCWDTAGNRVGEWSEISCDGNNYSGTWTGYVTSDCRFMGTNEWDSVAGTIHPTTKILTATGIRNNGCGSITINGTFTSDLISVTGNCKMAPNPRPKGRGFALSTL